LKGDFKGWLWEQMGVDEDTLEEFREAGGFGAMGGLAKEAGSKGLKKGKDVKEEFDEELANKIFDLQSKMQARKNYLKARGGAKGLADKALESMDETLIKLLKLKEDQEDREKPHSPSWVEYIGMTFGTTKKRVQQANQQYGVTNKMGKGISDMKGSAKKHYEKTQRGAGKVFDEIKKTRKAAVSSDTKMGKVAKGISKMGGSVWKILMFAFSILQGMINTAVGAIGNIFGPILNMLGIRWMFKNRKKKMSLGRRWKEQKVKARRTGRKGKTFAKTAGRLKRRFGMKTAAKFVAKRGLMGAGRVAGAVAGSAAGIGGAVAGGVIGMGMGIWDMVSAIREGESPEGFVGGWLTRGVAGFLGGKDTGVSGALSGAMKLGGIGAGIGLMTPLGPVGAMIGGAIGAAAGALLGFIGGKKISKAISFITDPLAKILKGYWAYITFPFRLIKEVVQFVKLYLTETKHGKKIWKAAKWFAKEAVLLPILPFRLARWASRKAKEWIGVQWQKLKDKYLGDDSWFGKIFTWVHDIFAKVGDIFTSVKRGVYKWFNGLIQKIKDIPFIGKFIKGIKEIHEGTFAEKRIAEIKSKEHFSNVAAGAAGGVLRPFEQQELHGVGMLEKREARRNSARYAREILGAESIVFKNGIAHLAKIGGKWFKLKVNTKGMPTEMEWHATSGAQGADPSKLYATKELSRRAASKAQLDAMGETISDKIGKTGNEANQISIGSTTMITNAVNNTSNTSTGGGGGGGVVAQNPWGSGHGASIDVTYSNLN